MTNLMTIDQYAQLRDHLASVRGKSLQDLHEIERAEGKRAVSSLLPCSCRNHAHYTIAWLKDNSLDMHTNIEKLCDIGLEFADVDIVQAHYTPEWYATRLSEPLEGSEGCGDDWEQFVGEVIQRSDCPPCPCMEEEEVNEILECLFQPPIPTIDELGADTVNEILNVWFKNPLVMKRPEHINSEMVHKIRDKSQHLEAQRYASTHDMSGNYIPEDERCQYRPGFWGDYLEKKHPPREKTLAKEKRIELAFGKMLTDQGISVQYQVHCINGIADIVTPDVIYEIKAHLTRSTIHKAIGQVLAYRQCINPSAKVSIVGCRHKRLTSMDIELASSLGVDVIVWEG